MDVLALSYLISWKVFKQFWQAYSRPKCVVLTAKISPWKTGNLTHVLQSQLHLWIMTWHNSLKGKWISVNLKVEQDLIVLSSTFLCWVYKLQSFFFFAVFSSSNNVFAVAKLCSKNVKLCLYTKYEPLFGILAAGVWWLIPWLKFLIRFHLDVQDGILSSASQEKVSLRIFVDMKQNYSRSYRENYCL